MSDESMFGIGGLAITPPVLGRISIGKMVPASGGKVRPSTDDQISITSNVQSKKVWIPHPLDEQLRVAQLAKKKVIDTDSVDRAAAANEKLRSIPVKLMFNDPQLNLRSEYTAFDRDNKRKGRVYCRGNGEKANRYDAETGSTIQVDCNPDTCDKAEAYRCKPYTRLSVQIDGQDDEMGTFMFRTTGWNSMRVLQSKLHYFNGASNGKLAGLPLELVIRGKTSQQSMGTTFYYLDLVVRNGSNIFEAVKAANAYSKQWEDAGMSRDAFEEAARQGLANGMFEDTAEESAQVMEEFYPESESNPTLADAPSLEALTAALDAEVLGEDATVNG